MAEKKTRFTKSKIVCTIGPATNQSDMLRKMIEAGMDVARLNFSHGTHDDHRKVFDLIRETSDKIAILCDIQGPKIRVGMMNENKRFMLKRGQEYTITNRDILGDDKIISTSYKSLPKEVNSGDFLYVNDGIIALKVKSIENEEDIVCEVVAGGEISSRKGINIPKEISAKVPTKKDVEDLKFIASLEADYVAVSFVSNTSDIHRVKEILEREGANIPIISKIERPNAVKNIESIIKESQAIMVARGDLGVELNPWKVPAIQKEIIKKCNRAGKPVICATQVLDSMTQNPIPTRAEASDCFNAIYEGADAVMLSGETSVGDYPLETIEMMERIIKEAETAMPHRDPSYYDSHSRELRNLEILGHLIATSIFQLEERGEDLNKLCILVITNEYATSANVSKYRPPVPILVVTSNQKLYRQLFLQWGVEAIHLPFFADALTTNLMAVEEGYKAGYLSQGDNIIMISESVISKEVTNNLGFYSVDDILSFGKI
ncbi:MAG: pyruvate kinase [Candidatus Helarchaeota archaeon]